MVDLDFRERQYIALYATDTLGLSLRHAGEPADADGDVVLTFVREPSTTVFSRTATRVGEGLYEVALTSEETSTPGDYSLNWFYVMDGDDEQYVTYAQVGQSSPAYDGLSPSMKAIVDDVWVRFADLFDSPGGGPNLLTYFQSHFGRNRIAQLLRIAVGRLNTMAQPQMTYTLDDGQGGGSFPVDQWGPLLETFTYVECVKHLIRSYVEQPAFMGSGAVTRLDRRDYMDRWRTILSDEQEMMKDQVEVFKIRHMGFGRPKVLVSGGVYGRYGPTRLAGSAAARPRYWTRVY